MTPWKLPLIVAAIAVPIAASFLLVGPALGAAVGALAAVAIVAVAVSQRPRGRIGRPPGEDGRRLLLVLSQPVEDPDALREIAVEAGAGERRAEVLVLAPARIGFLDRWASDVEAARRAAQERLVLTIASLAKVGVAAEARVGDEDLVQAVEDQLGSFPASEVILATGDDDEDPAGAAAAAELGSRLRAGFRRLVVSGRAGR